MAARAGAHVHGAGTHFAVWAPVAQAVALVLDDRVVDMRATGEGWYEASLSERLDGARYRYRVDGEELPDPASRFQPDGVHGPSEVVAAAFDWNDAGWTGTPLDEYVISEIHVGTFTREGTFDAAIEHLPELADAGFTAVELMPIAQFPGARNWGYDGVFTYAVQNTYGGPLACKRFVDAAHALGLSVVLDVVYNHLGPEGNWLYSYGPYFTDRYRTPWGDALNYDGEDSDEVRRYFVDSALQWIDEFHVDALRLDAVHAIVDSSAYPFVEQLAGEVHARAAALGRRVYAIAESAANDSRVITPSAEGGIGCDAQWSDDFHHALHALLTGERMSYYADFGRVEDLATAYREGYTYAHRYSVFHRRHHGRSAAGMPGERFVVFAQNHDHVGNRAQGERLASLVDGDGLRVAAAAVMLAPFVPLFFMGEEYGETNPFPYFVHLGDPALVEAVRKGRAEEFAGFHAGGEPPDPQSAATFERARLDRAKRDREPFRSQLAWHRALVALRRDEPAFRRFAPGAVTTYADEEARVLALFFGDEATLVLTFATGDESVKTRIPLGAGSWQVVLDSHPSDVELITSDGDSGADLARPARSALVLRRAGAR